MFIKEKSKDPVINCLNNEECELRHNLDEIDYDSLTLDDCENIIKGLDLLREANKYFRYVIISKEKLKGE